MGRQRNDTDFRRADTRTHESERWCSASKCTAPRLNKVVGPVMVRQKKKKKNKGRKKRGLPREEQLEKWGHGGLKKVREKATESQKEGQPGCSLDSPISTFEAARKDEASRASEQLEADLERAALIAVKVSTEEEAENQKKWDDERKEREDWEEFFGQLPRQSKEAYLQQETRKEEERTQNEIKGGEESLMRAQKKKEMDFHWMVLKAPDHHQTKRNRKEERHSADLLRDLTGEDTFEFELSSSPDSK